MISNVPTPLDTFVYRDNSRYTMSWRLYRALAGQTYNDQDRLLDLAWEEQNLLRQVLVWDSFGNITVRWLSSESARKHRASSSVSAVERERKALWAIYVRLRNKFGFNRDFADLLLEFRKTLEALNHGHV